MKVYTDGFGVLLEWINILTLSFNRIKPSYNNFNCMSRGRNVQRTLLGTILARLFEELEEREEKKHLSQLKMFIPIKGNS